MPGRTLARRVVTCGRRRRRRRVPPPPAERRGRRRRRRRPLHPRRPTVAPRGTPRRVPFLERGGEFPELLVTVGARVRPSRVGLDATCGASPARAVTHLLLE